MDVGHHGVDVTAGAVVLAHAQIDLVGVDGLPAGQLEVVAAVGTRNGGWCHRSVFGWTGDKGDDSRYRTTRQRCYHGREESLTVTDTRSRLAPDRYLTRVVRQY